MSPPVIPASATPSFDELDHVVRAHEQDVERVVLDARDEAPIVRLEHEAGVVRAGLSVASSRRPLLGIARRRRSLIARRRAGRGSIRRRRLEPLEHVAVAALAVVEPRRDPGDRRGARAGALARSRRSGGRRRAAGRPPSAGPCRGARRACTGRAGTARADVAVVEAQNARRPARRCRASANRRPRLRLPSAGARRHRPRGRVTAAC